MIKKEEESKEGRKYVYGIRIVSVVDMKSITLLHVY